MRSWARRGLILGGLVVGVVALGGCKRAKARSDSQSESTETAQEAKELGLEGVTEETIRITQVASFTGAQAGLGTEVYRGAMAWFLELNSRGGIHGRKIEIVPIDDKYTAEGGEEATERAITDERGFLVFGATGTEPMGGILKTLKKHESKKAFMWGSTSGAESSREGALASLAFNMRGSLKGAGKDNMEAYATAGLKRIGIVTQDDGFGKSAAGAARKAAEDKGMTVALELPISRTAKPGSATANDIVTKMRAANVDGVVLAATYNPSSVFVRDAREAGWQVPAATMGTPDTMLRFLVAHEKKTGKRMTNAVLGCTNVPPVSATELPAVREYRELMDRRNPRLPSQIADANYRPLGYASSSFEGFIMARVLGEALERAGKNLTRESARRAAESIVGWDPGVGQRITFGPNDNQGFDSIWLPGIKDDDFVLVSDMKRYLTDKPTPVQKEVSKDEASEKAVAGQTLTDKSAPAAVNAKTVTPKK